MVVDYKPIPGTTIIAVGHKARHGKDTFVDAILARCGHAKRFAFADALKAHCRLEHGMTYKDGPLLQRVGMERRALDPDVWVRALYYWIDEMRPRYALISDMRFLTELAMVKQAGGVTVRVTRTTPEGLYVASDRPATHVSETELDDATFDYDVRNDRGVGDLMLKAIDTFFHIDSFIQATK